MDKNDNKNHKFVTPVGKNMKIGGLKENGRNMKSIRKRKWKNIDNKTNVFS